MHRNVLDALPQDLSQVCRRLSEDLTSAGGRAVLVGGAVRDALRGESPDDADIEVFGLSVEQIRQALERHYRVDEVGRSFGVFKVKGVALDVSLPRRERKEGTGHKGFHIEGDPSMTFEEAASRRDFTINAIGWDLHDNRLLDPYHGQKDLANRCLRHVSERFAEDSLRVLRGMQFVARFDLRPDPATVALGQTIDWDDLPHERVFEEWRKLLLKGHRISAGMAFLRETGWVRFFPELQALIDCPQEPEWHPEGDVWSHSGHCLDAFARARTGDPWEDLVVGLAVLCHDLGKPATTETGEDGRIRSLRHDVEGEAPARSLLARLTEQKDLIEAVIPLVLEHMRPAQFYSSQAGDGAIRRMARRVGRIDRLARVVAADAAGRPPLDPFVPAVPWLLERAEALAVQDQAPKPLIQGRHLIALGHKQDRWFGEVLEEIFEAQLDGRFDDEEGGLELLRDVLARREAPQA